MIDRIKVHGHLPAADMLGIFESLPDVFHPLKFGIHNLLHAIALFFMPVGFPGGLRFQLNVKSAGCLSVEWLKCARGAFSRQWWVEKS